MKLFYLDKQNYQYKWHLILSSSFGLIASSYCLELAAQMRLSDVFQLDNQQEFLKQITTLHFLINSLTPLISGFIRDYFGDKFALIFQNLLCVFGQLVITLSISNSSKIGFIFGRIILGWGIESLLMVITSLICSYYKYTYLTFVLGIYQCIYLTGFVVCVLFAPEITNVNASSIIALIATILGFIMTYSTTDMDQFAEIEILTKEPKYFPSSIAIIKKDKSEMQWVSEILQDNEQLHLYQELPKDQQIKSEIVQPIHINNNIYLFNFQYPKIYWLLLCFYGLSTTSTLVSSNYANQQIKEEWLENVEKGEELSTKLVTLLWLFSGVISPLIGYTIDHVGSRSLLTIFSGFMGISAHFLIIMQSPFEGMLLMAFAFAITYATVWSAILYIIRPSCYGKALSLFICFQNLGVAIVPYIYEFLLNFTSFNISSYFFFILTLLALIASLLVYNEDRKFIKLIDRGLDVSHISTISQIEKKTE